jgi:hypothetical protein
LLFSDEQIDVLCKATAFKPEDRYESVTEFIDAFTEAFKTRDESMDQNFFKPESKEVALPLVA